MAKDRARDSKRVPSLGISDPISHVKKVAHGTAKILSGQKFDSNRVNSESSPNLDKFNRGDINAINERFRADGNTPVVKIKS